MEGKISSMSQQEIETAAQWIANSKRLVVFTGAGVSTESGLPDFRGPDGVWTRRDKGLPPRRSKPWHLVDPNPAHLAIVELQELGLLDFLISQNVDNLHLKSGIKLEKLAELHGNTTLMRCLECDKRMSFEEAGWDQKKWGKGYRTSPALSGQPRCPFCQGRLINSIVNFGDPLPEKDLNEALQHSKDCDVFLAIGSSLVVTPAAYMPQLALQAGAKVILLNKGETPFDKVVHLRLHGKAGEVMTSIVDRVKEILRSKES